MNIHTVMILAKEENSRLTKIPLKWLAPRINLYGIEIEGKEITAETLNPGLQINTEDAHVLRAALMVFNGWMDGSPADPEEVFDILYRASDLERATITARELLMRLEDWTE